MIPRGKLADWPQNLSRRLLGACLDGSTPQARSPLPLMPA